MGCTECGAEASTSIRVSYTTGDTEVLELCPDCREAFARGDLVSEVAPDEG